jgi:hypothetical protein
MEWNKVNMKSLFVNSFVLSILTGLSCNNPKGSIQNYPLCVPINEQLLLSQAVATQLIISDFSDEIRSKLKTDLVIKYMYSNTHNFSVSIDSLTTYNYDSLNSISKYNMLLLDNTFNLLKEDTSYSHSRDTISLKINIIWTSPSADSLMIIKDYIIDIEWGDVECYFLTRKKGGNFQIVKQKRLRMS